MRIYQFAIRHNGKFHKCYLDKDGRLWIPDKNGQHRQLPGRGFTDPEKARRAALDAIRQPDQQ